MEKHSVEGRLDLNSLQSRSAPYFRITVFDSQAKKRDAIPFGVI